MIDKVLREYGLGASKFDKCFYRAKVNGGILLVLLYVDDTLVAHEQKAEVTRLIIALTGEYGIKDLGEPGSFLGMSTTRHGDMTQIRQSAFIDELLYHFQMIATTTRRSQ